MDLQLGDVYVPAEGGYFVSERHARIAEILNDYDPTIELQWIPPDKRSATEPPFAVVKVEENGARYVICYSDDPDERLLARVWSMDNTKVDVLSAIEAHNAAIEAMKLKQEMDAMEEAHDFAYSVLRSPLHSYKHNGVRFD